MIVLQLFLLTLLSSISLVAQSGGGEDDLYFPAVLSVQVSIDDVIDDAFDKDGDPSVLLDPAYTEVQREITIRMETRESSAPLLPMVFFDQGSSTIPDRYVRLTAGDVFHYGERTDAVVFDRFGDDVLPSKYYEMLNVIGDRMTRFPATTITVRGGYSSEPGESEAIGRERSEVVTEYLMGVWRIAPERITILPSEKRAAADANIFERQEARRVTIASESWEIHRPLFYRSVAHDGRYLILHIGLDPKMSTDEIAAMELTAMTRDTLLASGTLPANGGPTDQSWTLLWALPRPPGRALGTIGSFPHDVTFRVAIRTINGGIVRSNDVTLPVRVDLLPLTEPEWLARRERKESRRLTEVPFFESGDTTLSTLQRMMIERMASDFMLKKSGLALVIWSHGGQEEYSGADPALMEIVAASPNNNRCLPCEFDAIPRPNGFVPLTAELLRDDDEMEDTLTMRAYSAIHRIDAEELMMSAMREGYEMERVTNEMTNHTDAGDSDIETLLLRRGEAVRAVLASRIDTTALGPIDVKEAGVGSTRLLPLPEQRMYHRRVLFNFFDPSEEEWSSDSFNDSDEPGEQEDPDENEEEVND